MIYILALTIAMSVIAALALGLSIKSLIEIKAMQKSTHTVQYVDPTIDALNEEYIREQEDNINKYNKEYSEELEETMPMFHSDADEKKVRSL